MIKKTIWLATLVTLSPGWIWAKKPPVLNYSIDNPYFSPNKDKVLDVLVLQVKAQGIKSVVSWEFLIKDSAGSTKRTITGLKNLPMLLTWNGLDDFGAPAAEGKYEASFIVWDKKNGPIKSEPVIVTLDLTPPTISFSAVSKKIPMKEGLVQPINLDLSAVDLSGIGSWEVQLQDYSGKLLYVMSSTQPLPNHLSLNPEKNKIPLGKVVALLSVTDRAGNRAGSPPVEFEIIDMGHAPAMEAAPAPEKSVPAGKYLQLTSILSIADLFGPGAAAASELTPQAAVLLSPLAQALQNSPNARATILAHVDSQSDAQAAKSLSSSFAWKTYSFFVRQKGIDKGAIAVRGMGNNVPIARDSTALGRSRNRRIEIQIFFPDEVIPK